MKKHFKFTQNLLQLYLQIRNNKILYQRSFKKIRYYYERYNAVLKHIRFIKIQQRKKHKALHKTPLKFMSYKFKRHGFSISRKLTRKIIAKIILQRINVRHRRVNTIQKLDVF